MNKEALPISKETLDAALLDTEATTNLYSILQDTKAATVQARKLVDTEISRMGGGSVPMDTDADFS